MRQINMFSGEERDLGKRRDPREAGPSLRGQHERISRLFAAGAPWLLPNFNKHALSELTRGEASEMIKAMERHLITRDKKAAGDEEIL